MGLAQLNGDGEMANILIGIPGSYNPCAEEAVTKDAVRDYEW